MPVVTGVLDRDLILRAARLARASHERYCRAALKIQTKEHGLRPFVWNDAQRLIHDKVTAQMASTGRIRCIILKSRQLGVSTWVASRLFWKCSLWPDRKSAVVADQADRSGTVMSIYERYQSNVPDALVPPQVTALKKRELAWANDSSIVVDTAGDEDVLRAATIHLFHATELAAWPHAETSWASAIGSVPKRGSEVYVESTAQGIGNLFERMWSGAVEGTNGYLPIFLPWWSDPSATWPCTPTERAEITGSTDPFERKAQDEGFDWEGRRHYLDPEQLLWRRKVIADDYEGNERIFRQECPSTPEEAFLVSGSGFFDEDRLKELAEVSRGTQVRRHGFARSKGSLMLTASERGELRMLERPVDGHYVIGADTATGQEIAAPAQGLSDEASERGGRDYNVAEVWKLSQWMDADPETGQTWSRPKLVPIRVQVAELHGHLDPDLFAERLYTLGMLYACLIDPSAGDARAPALIGIERNHFSGQAAIRWLIDHRYPNLYRRREFTQVKGAKPRLEYGFVTNYESRRMILDTFGAQVREGTSGVLLGDTVREMRTFVQDKSGKYQAQEGLHDDRVLASAIALEMERWHSHGPVGPARQITRRDSPTGV